MLWFFDTLVSFPVRHADGEDGLSVMESRATRGDSPPLHIHHTEDEMFHVLDGELVIRAGDATMRLGAGDTLLAPKGVPHTYLVVSEQARWLVITSRGAFERFVDAVSRPAEADTLPARSGPPAPDELQAVAELARRHEIELVGPPLHEAVLRTAA